MRITETERPELCLRASSRIPPSRRIALGRRPPRKGPDWRADLLDSGKEYQHLRVLRWVRTFSLPLFICALSGVTPEVLTVIVRPRNRQDAREALDIAALGKVKCHLEVKPLAALSEYVLFFHP